RKSLELLNQRLAHLEHQVGPRRGCGRVWSNNSTLLRKSLIRESGAFSSARLDCDLNPERPELLDGVGSRRNSRLVRPPLLEDGDLHRIPSNSPWSMACPPSGSRSH